MVDSETLRKLALSFPGMNEEPHFEKTSFRFNKKIVATHDIVKSQACVKLSAADQDRFAAKNPAVVFAAPNKWGTQGWTFVNLTRVERKLLATILTASYQEVALKKKPISKRVQTKKPIQKPGASNKAKQRGPKKP